MLDRLFFNKITPYNRTYIHIQLLDERVIMLPAINTAVFFLTNNDVITISDYESIDKLPYIDYQLLGTNEEFQKEMQVFEDIIKQKLYEKDFADFQVSQKQIIQNNVYILLKETEIIR